MPFFGENKDIAPSISDHLRSLLAIDKDRKKFIIESCAAFDAGEPFAKATYNLEGDGLPIFTAYSTLTGLSTTATQQHFSNVSAQARALGTTPQVTSLPKYVCGGARHTVFPGKIHYKGLRSGVCFQGSSVGLPGESSGNELLATKS